MRRRDHNIFSNAAALGICGLLAGLVVAAAAFPMVALTGLAAKAGADDFDNLPTSLRTVSPPQASSVYASDGKTLIATIYDENRRDVTFDQISPYMADAIVASEDSRFYQHHGVDFRGVARAFVNNNSNGGDTQGASTLTMQYIRQETEFTATTPQEVLDATADTYARKINEMHEAIALEQQLTQADGSQLAAKHDILTRYLNIAWFGQNTYGIYAASEVYFGITPDKLTLAQSALLAGIVQGPSLYDPTQKVTGQAAVDRRNTHVLPQMLQAGMITQAQEQEAIATPLKLHYTPPKNGCTQTLNPASWGFFCDYLERWWDQQEAFGADTFTRQYALETGGYTIISSLDVKAQAAAQKAIKNELSNTAVPTLMLVGVQPGTGRVEVMAANRKFDNDLNNQDPAPTAEERQAGVSQTNRPNTTVPLLTGDLTTQAGGYQFGSSFKMFTTVAALEDGLPLSYKINAPTKYVSNFPAGTDASTAYCGGYYCPKNSSNGEAGSYNIATGFGHSVNTFFVPLEDRLTATGTYGPEQVYQAAKNLGVNFGTSQPEKNVAVGSLTLGTPGVYPLDMATAYATVAAEGSACKPTPIVSITDFSGNKISAGDPQCHQAISKDIADTALDAAQCPVGRSGNYGMCTGGTAANTEYPRVGTGMHGVKWFAGKTGTTDAGLADAFIGMTPQLTIAGELTYTNGGQALNCSICRGYEGIHWKVNTAVANTLQYVAKNEPSSQGWSTEPRSLAFGTPANVPGFQCTSKSSAEASLTSRGFRPYVMLKAVSSACPAGTVASTDPSGTSVQGAVVALYISNGTAPTPTGPPTGFPGGPGNGGPGTGGPGTGGGGGTTGGGGGGGAQPGG